MQVHTHMYMRTFCDNLSSPKKTVTNKKCVITHLSKMYMSIGCTVWVVHFKWLNF